MSSPAPAPALSPRRQQLLDAALHVVADEGLRGLTHRAVDRRAGLPEGSCSAYLRTRRALQAALTEYVAGTLAADVAGLAVDLQGCEESEDRAVDLTMRLFLRWLGERELLIAKLELSMEASRDPELAGLLAAYRSRLVEVVDGIMAARGKDSSNDRAEALVASFDGILFAALQKPDRARKAFLARSLRLLMASLVGPALPAPTPDLA
ncbi:MAG: regulatory protein TetR [Nocardioides sp.]|nr:regulatory protein TetR [Nocardioides sp.]